MGSKITALMSRVRQQLLINVPNSSLANRDRQMGHWERRFIYSCNMGIGEKRRTEGLDRNRRCRLPHLYQNFLAFDFDGIDRDLEGGILGRDAGLGIVLPAVPGTDDLAIGDHALS